MYFKPIPLVVLRSGIGFEYHVWLHRKSGVSHVRRDSPDMEVNIVVEFYHRSRHDCEIVVVGGNGGLADVNIVSDDDPVTPVVLTVGQPTSVGLGVEAGVAGAVAKLAPFYPGIIM